MEVADRQQLSLALGEPVACSSALTLGAVPVAAAVIGDPPTHAGGASFNVAANCCGAAVPERRHYLELGKAQVPGIGRPVGWARTPQPSVAPCWPRNIASLSGGLITVLTARVASRMYSAGQSVRQRRAALG